MALTTTVTTEPRTTPRAFDELEKLLAESPAACRIREAEAFDAATSAMPRQPLVLLGAGGLGQRLAKIMRAHNIDVAAFCDNAERLWGTPVDGIPVMSPASAAERYGRDAVFVVAIWSAFSPGTSDHHIRHLRSLGCRCAVPFQLFLWKHAENLPYFNVDLPTRVLEQSRRVWDCMQLWSDEDSREEFMAQVRARLLADFNVPSPYPCREYYPADLTRFDGADAFVDVGAFDGDSLSSFIEACAGRFASAVAFEPDPENFRKLCSTIATSLARWQSRIGARQQAVSRKTGSMSLMSGLGMSSRAGENGVSIPMTTVDSLLEEEVFPTYIKYDVEGHELHALEGSARTISVLAPSLAICVYHLQDHLWKVPLAIRDANPDYRFYLRPHGFIWDEVCYAIPALRGSRNCL